MNFVNFWSRPVELAAGATALALDLPDGTYRLTIADKPSSGTAWEIVDAVVSGGAATLTRALESTEDLTWPSGSVIYLALTAAQITELFGKISSLESRVTALENPVVGGATLTPSGSMFIAYSWVTSPGATGSIDPAGYSTIPGAEAAPGADGELLVLRWYSGYGLMCYLRGPYENIGDIPFSAMNVGGTLFNSADAFDFENAFGSEGGNDVAYCFFVLPAATNPLTGPVSLSFS